MLTGAVDKPFTFNAPCSYGHENCIIGAVNIENNEVNKFKTQITEYGEVPSLQATAGIKKSPCLAHTFNEGQIEWFKLDSSLNLPAADAKAKAGSSYR
ncbi:hypothetical protein H1R20_g10659, partial [Candolleomyces eurysporus]